MGNKKTTCCNKFPIFLFFFFLSVKTTSENKICAQFASSWHAIRVVTASNDLFAGVSKMVNGVVARTCALVLTASRAYNAHNVKNTAVSVHQDGFDFSLICSLVLLHQYKRGNLK